MKKISLTLVFVSLFCAAIAQTTSGSMLLGGQLTFTSFTFKDEGVSFTEEEKATTFALIPNFGYFISDNLAIGLGAGISTSKFTDEGDGTEVIKSSQFVVAPWLRYYVPTSSEQFFFFVQARPQFGFGTETTDFGNGESEDKLSSLNVFVSPGFSFFPTEKWSIELVMQGIGFSSSKTEFNGGGTDKTSGFVFDVRSFSPSLGINVFF
jgi:hypothetical protein